MRRFSPIVVFAALLLAACQTSGDSAQEMSEQGATAEASLASAALESRDWGVQPTEELRVHDYHAPTPTTIVDAKLITTDELRGLIASDSAPVLIDVLDGRGHQTIPGAVWLPDAGLGGSGFADKNQTQLAGILQRLTEGDQSRTIVMFCLGPECWLSHNAALRAVRLGYTDVRWYRGGLQAWKASGMPTVQVRKGDRAPLS